MSISDYITIFFLIVLFIFFYLTSGCAVTQEPKPTENISTSQQIIFNTIKSTDWILSILLIGTVIGIFAGLNGMKTGWAGVMACIGGMVLKAAFTSTYVYWFCGLIFLGTVLAALASIIWKNKAVKELIISNQYMKQHVDPATAKEVFSVTQSKDTSSLVNTVKAKLKTKGVL